MGRVKHHKPRRAKCHECGKGMIRKRNAQKYHASCLKIVRDRQTYESQIRTGKIKNPGIGKGNVLGGPQPWLRGEQSNAWKRGCRPWQVENFRGTECERCGSKEEMHLHHRDRDWHNWKKGNLETLCAECHYEEHRGEVHAAA